MGWADFAPDLRPNLFQEVHPCDAAPAPRLHPSPRPIDPARATLCPEMARALPQPGSGLRLTAGAALLIGSALASPAAATVTPPAPSGPTAGLNPDVEFVNPGANVSEDTAGTVQVLVSLSSVAATDVEVPFTVSGSAGAGDRTVDASPLVIPAGDLQGSIDITVLDDGLGEGVERVVLELGAPSVGALGAQTGYELVIDDDEPAATVEFTAATLSAGEGAGSVLLTATLSAARTEEARVSFVQSGTAEPSGVDVLVTPASPMTFAPGATSVDLTVDITQDLLDEDDETLEVRLLVPVNCSVGAQDRITLTVTDDDDPPTVECALAASAAVETDSSASVEVVLSAPSSFDVTVPVGAAGSATLATDYTYTPTSLVIPAGSTSGFIDVAPIDDMDVEGAETIELTLGAPTGADLGATVQHDLLLVDDDGPTPTVEFELVATSVGEDAGVVSMSVSASEYAPQPILVPVSAAGSATAGVDYDLLTTSLTIPVGELTGMVEVSVIDDTVIEPTEMVSVSLGSPTGADLGASADHSLEITDDDELTVDFAAATSGFGEADGIVTVDVVLSGMAASDVTVPVLLSGTAEAGGTDVTVTPQPLVILAGESTGAFSVEIAQDLLFEVPETLVLELGTPTGAVLGSTTTIHTLTITDDDPMPSVEFGNFRFVTSESSGVIDLRLRLSEAAGADVTVPLVASGEASGSNDIMLPASPPIIPAGDLTLTVPIDVVVDSVHERPETVLFAIGAPTNATVGATNTFLVLIAEPTDPGVFQLPSPLVPSATDLAFPQTRVGESSAPLTVQYTNLNPAPVTLQSVSELGPHWPDFGVSVVGGLPAVVNPGANVAVEFTFTPLAGGVRSARFETVQDLQAGSSTAVSAQAIALGPAGRDVRITARPGGFVSPSREYWAPEYGESGGSVYAFSGVQIAGTELDGLYRTVRFGQLFSYGFEVPNGLYEVRFRSFEPNKNAPGERLMDVRIEGALAFDDLDLYAEVGKETAYGSPAVPVNVTDGVLEIEFEGVLNQALVSAIEISSIPILSTPTPNLAFGTVDQGASATLDFVLDNAGLAPGLIDRVGFNITATGDAADFTIEIGGVTYAGEETNVVHAVDLTVPPGSTAIPVTFTPTYHADHIVTLTLESTVMGEAFEATLSATGGAEAGWGFLHPVPDQSPTFIIDYDADGSEDVQLLGAESHTHEPGHFLAGYQWTVAGAPYSTDVDTAATLPVGTTLVELEIEDDNTPPSTASDTREIVVHPVDAVPGLLVNYYDGSVVGEMTLLDAVPALPTFVERRDEPVVVAAGGRVGRSTLTEHVMLTMGAEFELGAARTLEFIPSGGADHRLFVDGAPASGPQSLAAGPHGFEVRFAVTALSDLPVALSIEENSAPAADVIASLTHDRSPLPPVIHQMPTVGTDLGGNRITIDGFGFFPKDSVVVHWGGADFTAASFEEWTGEMITLTTPPGAGTVPVTVETPNGVSNAINFNYSPTGPIPVRFDLLTGKELSLPNVTTGAFGPDGRLYVASVDGHVHVITYEDDWDVFAVETKAGVSGLTNADTMGLAFNPFDAYDPNDPSSIKLYVSHGEQFQNGGGAFSGPSYYTGQVSVLEGPNFDTPVPLITELPVSNHDHAINGMYFDDNGDLMLCSGGNTNAGVAWPLLGDVPESPLSGAILRARTSDPNFNGDCVYLDSASGVPSDDQVFGEAVDLDPSVDIEVWACGFRNAWDMVLHTNGSLYATDNGPNMGYGPGSITLTTDTGPLPTRPDELNLVEKGNYHGSANRNRGRYDDRQSRYYPPEQASIPDVYTAPLREINSSTNGITEYRSTAFNSAMRGDLIAMKWNFGVYRFVLADHGRRVAQALLYQSGSNSAFLPNRGLDVVYGPGGALVAVDYSGGKVRVQVPDDVSAVGVTPFDISPWRTPAGGGQPFVIGGVGFGTNPTIVSVRIGGIDAAVTSVSDTRIRGVFPPSPTGEASGMLDVEVQVGVTTRTIPEAMRFLPAAPGQALSTWTEDAQLPIQLGEVSCGVLDGKLYIFGQGDGRTLIRDLLGLGWDLNKAQRPFPGNHHALEVFDGRIYLIGGLDNGSAGRVQIYDPALDQWSLGAPMPWNGGSCATALIDGLIYVGGGNLQGGGTAGNFAVYDPVLDSWTPLGAMPTPVNHAAAGTDGERLFVFGGRQGNNVPQPGFDDVQIYDPVTATWETSDAAQVEAMPKPRGGTGRAVFIDGEFWIMGGENSSIAFEDVQVYDPVADTWRDEAPMPTPRHGIFPAFFQGRLHVVGGGLVAGFGVSAVHEVLSPR